MGNASSRQQAVLSETPTFFTQEELSKLKSEFETGGVENVQPLLEKKVKELDNTELNIAVTGDTGAGKSTFINAMRGLRSEDEGAAAVGNTEATMEPTGYPHPNLPNFRYWDLPGIGTTRFTAGSYMKEMKFKKYDFFIIVAAGRFTENDANLAKEIKRLGKEFYFVRSKIDADLDSMRQQRDEFDEDAEMETIRSDCVSGLGKAGIPDPNVFLISSFKKNMYDFPLLMEALADGLPKIKKSVFVLALPNLSVEVIRRKGEVLKERIWMSAILAGGVGAIPIPGISAACDMAILIVAITYFRKCLCLNDAALGRLADRTGTSVEELKAAVKSSLLEEISVKVIVRLGLGTVVVAVSAVEAALYFVPVCRIVLVFYGVNERAFRVQPGFHQSSHHQHKMHKKNKRGTIVQIY
ncbi:interferon-inducible GTPase 5-like [Amblyraja radiata]|uniref:interferon-inducible GTPase 5-like n=1 Tax=Amblyraja radiata TaxID=386614 RepID=UPI0014037597|nr:interferon-inducible GTPase 5-like [Amblyraja radiata]